MHICDSYCVYFPQEPTKIITEYVDFGTVKHRKSIYLCNYNDKRIVGYKECKYYKKVGDSNK